MTFQLACVRMQSGGVEFAALTFFSPQTQLRHSSGSVLARGTAQLAGGCGEFAPWASSLGSARPGPRPPCSHSLPAELSMLFPVRLTALRRCVRTVSAAARPTAALRLSRAEPPAPEGLAQSGEPVRLFRTHGGGRHGQGGQGGGGHGDRA